MRRCETTSKYLAGLGVAILLYVGIMGGTPALAGHIDVPGLPKTSAFVLWAVLTVAIALVPRLRCRLPSKNSSRE